MFLNKNGVIARFYAWSHGRIYKRPNLVRNLPENFCPFFWGLVMAVLFLPMSLLSVPVHKLLLKLDDEIDVSWGLVRRTVAACLGSLVVAMFIAVSIAFVHDWPISGLALLIVVVGVVVVFGGGFLITSSISYFIHSETKEIVSEKIHSFKEGYCPKITWR